VRVPRGVAKEAGLKLDDALDVEVVRGRIVMTPAKVEPPRYDLEALVKKIDPRSRYGESDFGKRAGREAW
jgi:antitoxin component of MazEF toxin-antitoxin module